MSTLGTEIRIEYSDDVEAVLIQLDALLGEEYALSKRSIGLLLLQGDVEIETLVRRIEGEGYDRIQQVLADARSSLSTSLNYLITMQRQQASDRIADRVQRTVHTPARGFAERLSRITMNPLTGIPILLLVLYYGLYKFVGVFGAGTVVDFLESAVFEARINPFLVDVVSRVIPWPLWRDLFVGEYGLLTLGVRYAIAIVLPIVGTFFIMFSIMEDSGYFPRLAMLVDRLFKRIGLNGRAVIPMVLGLGCDTMAVMVTRILETKRERVIAVLLLALAVPCSAQLGVIMAMLSVHPRALIIWVAVVFGEFLVVGYLSSRLMPGERPRFYMELPPLRIPSLRNVLAKTWARMRWYFLEVFPFFVLASVFIWIGQLTGLFDLLIRWLEPLVQAIGLPKEAADAFLFGFFRRDYAAARLFDERSMLSARQLAVAAVTITLFLPCVAQLLVMIKERGWRTALAITVFIFPAAFATGYVLNLVLSALNVL